MIDKICEGDDIEYGSYPQTKEGDTFKVEPIRWRVLKINNGQALLLSEKILDARVFDSSYVYKEGSNNYANSEIRKWLNGEFYNNAFSIAEKLRILTTNVDNSGSSTCPHNDQSIKQSILRNNKYACEDTRDKIFLLSQYEVTNENYFHAWELEEELVIDLEDHRISRLKYGTDYAKSRGLKEYEFQRSYFSEWWLRSPSYFMEKYAQFIRSDGAPDGADFVNFKRGVVPAMRIFL